MADLRSKSFGDLNKEVVQSQPYFSAFAHSHSYSEPGPNHMPNPNQSANGAGNFNGMKNSKSKSAKSWSLSDPEVKRRKRVASYKVYAVEGRVKASFLKSFRWIKDKYTDILQGCHSYSGPGTNHMPNPDQSASACNFNGMKNSKSKSAKSWSLSDPEVKRRKRVASYKVYAVEGRVKASFLKSFRWIKDKYTDILQGWRSTEDQLLISIFS